MYFQTNHPLLINLRSSLLLPSGSRPSLRHHRTATLFDPATSDQIQIWLRSLSTSAMTNAYGNRFHMGWPGRQSMMHTKGIQCGSTCLHMLCNASRQRSNKRTSFLKKTYTPPPPAGGCARWMMKYGSGTTKYVSGPRLMQGKTRKGGSPLFSFGGILTYY